MSKEDFDEIDLRNSIQSIDKRLSVLIGQTQLMFAAQRLPEMNSRGGSPSKEMQSLNPRVAIS